MNGKLKNAPAQPAGLLVDSVWSTATTGVTVGLQMVEIMILSRVLSKELLGSYFLVTAFPEVVQGVLDLRLQEVMIKYLIGFIRSGEIERVSALVKVTWIVSAMTGILTVVIVAVTASLASAIVNGAASDRLMLLYAFGLFLGSLQGRSGAIIRAFNRFDLNFWIALVIAVLRLALVVAPVLLGFGLSGLIEGRVVAQCIGSVIIGTTSYLLLRARVPLDLWVPLGVLRPIWKEIVHFSFHLNLASIAKSLAQRADTIVVGTFMNPGGVAAYKVIGQLGRALYLISDPLTTAAYPRFVQLTSRGDVAGLNRMARRASVMVGLALIPALLVCTIFPGLLVHAFAGPQYIGSAWLLPLFMWTNVAGIVFFWTHPYLLSVGLPQYSSLANIIGRLAGILAFSGLVVSSSLPGAAIGSGLPAAFSTVVALWLISRLPRHGQSAPASHVTPHPKTISSEECS